MVVKEIQYWPGDTVDIVVPPMIDPFGVPYDYSELDGEMTLFDVDETEILNVESDVTDNGELHIHLTVDDTVDITDQEVYGYRVIIKKNTEFVRTIQAGRIRELEI